MSITVNQTIKRGDRYNFQFYQGDLFTWKLALTDENDQAVDLTGLTATLKARLDDHDTTAAWSLAGTNASDPTTGVSSFAVTATHTGNVRRFIVELQLTASGVQLTHNQFDLFIMDTVS